MDVNDILSSKITKLDYTLIPPGFRGDMRTIRLMQDSLAKIIDNLGQLSSRAQGLNKAITTAEKLRNSTTHVFYMLKDESGNGGRGEAIGYLKVGYKKLYLFDQHDKVCEVEPLCVLDFYVLRDRERQGYGKMLFDHMVQDAGVYPKQLAIDGPSEKMAAFLRKNYGFTSLVRQANNFAVEREFFTDPESWSGRSTPAQAVAAVGRYAAKKPHSSIGDVIHGGTPFNKDAHANNNGTDAGLESATPTPPPERGASAASGAGAGAGAARPSSLLIETQAPPTPEPELEPLPPLPPATPTGRSPSPAARTPFSAAGGAPSRRDSQVTEQGFFDIKFYHNKLW